ncbi:MAG: hypothetical protein P8166_05770 [Candidatus Thiodiazotropha sp.]
MKSILLPIHLSFAGIWLGCILTEALFERALLGKGRESERILVALHKRVDLLLEIPAFSVVLVSGALLYPAAAADPLLHLKIGLGLLAVSVNAYCVWLVFQRASAANQGDWDRFSRLDHKQHQYGTVVLLIVLLALIVGVSIYGDG